MSYQVVIPATGEIAAVFGSGTVANLQIASKLCDKLHAEGNERWDVIQIEIVYTRGEDGSKSRGSGTNR